VGWVVGHTSLSDGGSPACAFQLSRCACWDSLVAFNSNSLLAGTRTLGGTAGGVMAGSVGSRWAGDCPGQSQKQDTSQAEYSPPWEEALPLLHWAQLLRFELAQRMRAWSAKY